jgi:crossover junction endodeoxyribonuclease RusA
MIDITLPWPPTMNTYWRQFRGRLILSAKGREYRVAVADQVALQQAAHDIDKPVRVEIEAFRPDRRKRDLDNLLKAVLDGMAHAGVYQDDSQIQDLRIYWAPVIGGMVKVKIEVLE